MAAASIGKSDTKVGELRKELGVTRQTLYRYVSPMGSFDPTGCGSSAGRRRDGAGRTSRPPGAWSVVRGVVGVVFDAGVTGG